MVLSGFCLNKDFFLKKKTFKFKKKKKKKKKKKRSPIKKKKRHKRSDQLNVCKWCVGPVSF